MTMRRILPCVLVLLVAVMSGCSWWSSGSTNSVNKNSGVSTKTNADATTTAAAPRPTPTIKWELASENLQKALDKISSSQTPAYTARLVGDDISKALKELGKDDEEVKNKCNDCENGAIVAAQSARKSMVSVMTILQPLQNTPLTAQTKNQITPALEDAKKKLNTASSMPPLAEGATLVSRSPSPTSSSTPEDAKTDTYTFWDLVIFGLAIAASLLILVLLGMGILHLRNRSIQHLEHQLAKVAAANTSVTREAQKEILEKLSSLSSAQHDTNTRLHDVTTEIRTLARLVRESSASRGDGRAYTSLGSSYGQHDPSPPKDDPDFPISAGDYLGKMTRFANVVRPDFQNGILISDGDGTGELVLIRDSRLPDETQPLFVVPRHAQFQTKQDFHTYYAKYYDCVRPGAGEVWIVEPAVVEKVSGGWQLREKGVLEIR